MISLWRYWHSLTQFEIEQERHPPMPEEKIISKPGVRPYKYRGPTMPAHSVKDLSPHPPDCPGCLAEQAQIDSLGPLPPASETWVRLNGDICRK